MGEWRPVQTLYGQRERWHPNPAFYRDWPRVEDEPDGGCLPQPCERCLGTLTRWAHRLPTDEQVHARHEKLMRLWRLTGGHGPEPQPEPQQTIVSYDLSHGAACLPAVPAPDLELRRPHRV